VFFPISFLCLLCLYVFVTCSIYFECVFFSLWTPWCAGVFQSFFLNVCFPSLSSVDKNFFFIFHLFFIYTYFHPCYNLFDSIIVTIFPLCMCFLIYFSPLSTSLLPLPTSKNFHSSSFPHHMILLSLTFCCFFFFDSLRSLLLLPLLLLSVLPEPHCPKKSI
jgi:hypothetical protein